MKKNLKLFTFAFALLFAIVVKVNAETVTTWDELKTCLTTSGTATCETTSVMTSADEKVDVVGNKTLILGDTLTIKQRIKIGNGATLVVKGNVTAARHIFFASTGATLELEEGTFKSLSRTSAAYGVYIYGGDTPAADKTYVKIGKDAKIEDAGIAIFSPAAGVDKAYGITVDVYGDINMTKSESSTYQSFTTNGEITANSGENLPVINFYDGSSVTNEEAPAIYASGYAIWNIKGGTFTGSEALAIKSGKFNITGGTFIANGEYVAPENVQTQASASEDTGAAISITGNIGFDLKIEDAKVESKNGYAIFEGVTNGATSVVKNMLIEDGNFEGKVGAVYSKNVTEFIEGGEFKGEVDKKIISEEKDAEEKDGVTYIGESIPKEESKEEVKEESKEDVKNPDTGDSVMLFVILGLMSLVSIGYIVNKLRKNA